MYERKVAGNMGKYFGREPRYSREEIERQAQEAIDVRVGLGRPPAEEWEPLVARMAEIDLALATRPPVPAIPEPAVLEDQPMKLRRVKVSPVTGAVQPAPAPSRARRPVAARQPAN